MVSVCRGANADAGGDAEKERAWWEGNRAIVAAARWSAVVFPVAAWLMATLYMGGKIGHYCDDYSLNMLDPTTGRADPTLSPFSHNPYFWRPAHQFLTSYLLTYLWNDFAVFHWLEAVVHGLVGVAIWRLSSRLTRNQVAAIIPALLFVVMPFSYEVTLWCTSWVIAMGALLSVWVLVLCADVARGKRSWRWMPVIAALAFLVPCFYEQPGAGLAPVALLYLAVCPRSEPWKRRLWRAGVMTGILGATQLMYVALLAKTAPEWARGGAASLVHPSEAPARLNEVVKGVAKAATEQLPEIVRGSFRLGHEEMGTWRGMMAYGALAACGGIWLLWAIARRRQEGPVGARPEVDTASGRLFAGAFGVAVAVAAWLPVASLKSQVIEPRMFYFGIVGLALTFAWLLDLAHDAARRARLDAVLRACVAAPAVGAVCYLSVCCVGMQRDFRTRSRADEYQVAALRAMFPDPPAQTVFVTLEDDYRPARTGLPQVDSALLGWTSTAWSSSPCLRLAYGRRDVHALERELWGPLILTDLDADGFRSPHFPVGATPAIGLQWDAKGGLRASWAQAVPFVIDAEGRLRLVDRLFIERPGNDDLEIRLPLVTEAVERGAPHGVFVIASTAAPEGGAPLGGWKWAASGAPAGTGWSASWGVGREAMWMHPSAEGGGRAAAETTLESSTSPTLLLFRATLDQDGLATHGGGAEGVEVSWYLDGTPDAAGRIELSPKRVRDQQRWFAVTIQIPPDSGERVLLMRVTARAEGDPDVPDVLVTPGWRVLHSRPSADK
jgi:hypothetical protein